MKGNTHVQIYDEYGMFIVREDEIAELIPNDVLEQISGGFLNGGCNGNGLCGNLANIGACVNAGCGNDLRDAACYANVVCV